MAKEIQKAYLEHPMQQPTCYESYIEGSGTRSTKFVDIHPTEKEIKILHVVNSNLFVKATTTSVWPP